MDLRLSWSPTQIAVVFVIIMLLAIYARRKRIYSLKKTILMALGSTAIMLFIAIDVGTPQSQFDRAQFDAKAPSSASEFTDNNRMTVDDAVKKFDQTIEKSQNTRRESDET